MKICAACHEDLPKESYSKKQWKLDECQRRCKVCTANNREVQQQPQKQDDEESNTGDIIKALDSMYLKNIDRKISDEELFKQPPPQYGDCPICFIQIPTLHTGSRYKACCGKVICSSCSYAPVYDHQGNEVDDEKCAFCRTLKPATSEEAVGRSKKRVEVEDPLAIHRLGCFYADELYGYPQDYAKALKLWHRAGELGCSKAYNSIGFAYNDGEGVEVDKKKAVYYCYWELAAVMGNTISRHNLGVEEENNDNYDRALRHYMIAAGSGDNDSLTVIQRLYTYGRATKDDYMKALQSDQMYLGEIKSSQRDKAAATYENCRYY